MKKLFRRSFRARLFSSILLAALLPLLLSSIMIIRAFMDRQAAQSGRDAEEKLLLVAETLDTMKDGLIEAGDTFSADPAAKAAGLLSEDKAAPPAAGYSVTELNGALFRATGSLRSFASFDVYDSKGSWLCSTRNAPDKAALPTDWGLLKKAEESGELVFESSEDVTDLSTPELRAAVPVAGGNAFLVAEFYEDGLRSMFEGKYGAQNDLFLLDRFWRPVYCDTPELAEALSPVIRERFLETGSLEDISDSFLYSTAAHTGTGLITVLRRPQVFTVETRSLFRRITLTAVFIGFCLTLFISFGLSAQLMKPVNELRGAMTRVAFENLDVQVEHGEDELGELAERFNSMVRALQGYRAELFAKQERLVRNQKELNEAQIRMLQAQLNPHFLCNTLDSMKWIGKINRLPEVATMSTDLADILRFAISPEEFVPLEKELAVLDRYLEIQKIRQSGRLTFLQEIPEELLERKVPKMILQPLVENAVLHGLDNADNGMIVVRAEEVPVGAGTGAGTGTLPDIRIIVVDNGRGLPPGMEGPYKRPEGEAARHHLGLYNVDTILKKHYGEQYGLYMRNVRAEDFKELLPEGELHGAVVSALIGSEEIQNRSGENDHSDSDPDHPDSDPDHPLTELPLDEE